MQTSSIRNFDQQLLNLCQLVITYDEISVDRDLFATTISTRYKRKELHGPYNRATPPATPFSTFRTRQCQIDETTLQGHGPRETLARS